MSEKSQREQLTEERRAFNQKVEQLKSEYVPSRDRSKKQRELAAKGKDKLDTEAPQTDADDTDGGVGNKPLEFTLKSVDASHDYLSKRGIKQEVAEHFGAGYFFGKGSMAGKVVIPIHNETGDLIAYAGRAIDDEDHRPGDLEKQCGVLVRRVFGFGRNLEHQRCF